MSGFTRRSCFQEGCPLSANRSRTAPHKTGTIHFTEAFAGDADGSAWASRSAQHRHRQPQPGEHAARRYLEELEKIKPEFAPPA